MSSMACAAAPDDSRDASREAMLDADVCYRALVAKDRRFDGLFFVGISTTGIYCRSVCPAKKPRTSSCSFYPSAAAAEQAGFRPCRRCKPEHAPATPIQGEGSALATGIVARIQEGDLNDGRHIGDLAAAFELSERQLRRLVRKETGVSPVALAQTARLLLARRLLSETDLAITRVAFDSGFSSLRRFNELFAKEYGVSPRELRRPRSSSVRNAEIVLRLDYRPPFAWQAIAEFLAARAIPNVERVDTRSYERTVAMGSATGRIRIQLDDDSPGIRVRVSQTLSRHLQPILARIRHLFDLNAAPDLVDEFLGSDAHLANAVRQTRGLRVPGAFDGFELAWRALLDQHAAGKSARLAGRFAERFGKHVDPAAGPSLLTPTSAEVARQSVNSIASIGVPIACAESILAMARLQWRHPELFVAGASPVIARGHLASLPGIETWTIELILMRALHFPDAFPGVDRASRRAAMRMEIRDLDAAAARWRPWRAYAFMHLWRSANAGGRLSRDPAIAV